MVIVGKGPLARCVLGQSGAGWRGLTVVFIKTNIARIMVLVGKSLIVHT